MTAGMILAIWIALMLAIQGLGWVVGLRTTQVAMAVEAGSAEAERRELGEAGDDAVREAIELQRASEMFWSVIGLVGDLVVEPSLLLVRSLLVAVAFSGIAAFRGREIGFAGSWRETSFVQGMWVLRACFRLAMGIVLGRPWVESAATLLLPEGDYAASVWACVEQLDAFVLLGWAMMAWGGYRRGQVGAICAVLLCGVFWLIEGMLRVGMVLLLEGGMRLTLLPD
jgi:hypothetical protein